VTTAIILAAGVGKRLAATHGDLPKCLIEVGGVPMVTRLIDGLATAGVRRVVLVTGYGDAQVRRRLGDGPAGTDLTYVFNERFREGAILSLWSAR
jgi:NDP-sugar pyrophosphorylase family protein